MTGAANDRGASPFRRSTVFGIVLVGFTAFLAMLYFIGAGDTGGRDRNGAAHAVSNGLNGYSALTRLLEARGISVTRTRSRAAFDTSQLLVLTPSIQTDAEEFAQILDRRSHVGPTLVILPKWIAAPPPENLSGARTETFEDDWVRLLSPIGLPWTKDLTGLFTFEHRIARSSGGDGFGWEGLGARGDLPTPTVAFTQEQPIFEPLVRDASDRVLAFHVYGDEGSYYYDNAYPLVFVVEPDLVNNYGLADPSRAALALKLIEEAGEDDLQSVSFDLALAGLGDSTNLLTLAFQPPFLAATLCLLLALVVVAWRAFLRFGPSAAPARPFAFGKARLVENGAGLIVRSRRARLLAEPYILLIQRRLARMLALKGSDPQRIDEALARRLPGAPSYTERAAALRRARTPADIMRASRALDELTKDLTR